MVDTHVSETDAFTLQLERDPLLRSTIVAIAMFDRPPDWERLNDRVERATRIAPTFRKKLVPSPFGLASPRWELDPDFDLSWHLRRARVPARGGFDAVLDHARNAGMTAFDHERPLWEFTLMEGLPNGRAALVMKVHHSLTDGIGGVSLAAHVADLTRKPGKLESVPEAPQLDGHGPFEPLVDAVSHDLRQLVRAVTGIVRTTPGAVIDAVRDPVHAVTGLATTTMSVARFVRPVTTTSSPVMRDRRLQWHYDTLDVPFADLKAAGAAVGGTLNDAFVAAIAGGFRRYHELHEAPVDQLRITMPISIRGDDEGVGGNRVTLARFGVPVGVVSPADRVARIGALCRDARREPAIAYSNLLAGVFNLLPVAVTGGMLKHVDLLASNVPGFPSEIFVGGARMDAFYPFGPTLGSAANITLMSYAGTCHIGINTDVGAVPDADELTRCLHEGFDEVLALAAA
jgi:WS/DGAT/MGAT family acyltransferase